MARRLALSVALIASIAGSSHRARAQDAAAAAEMLFSQGKALTEKGDYATACPKFEASYKLDRTLGTLLNLADCEEHIAKVATAWAHWGEAVEMAKRAGDKRVDYAAGRREKLAPRLPSLQVDIARPVASIDVLRDGAKIEPGAYNVPLPTDPGRHTVSVQRGKQLLEEQVVDTKEGETATVALDLVAIDKAVPPPPDAVAPIAPSGTGQRTAGFVIGGVGLVTLGVAGALEIAALSNKSAANQPDACLNGFCAPNGLDAAQRARTFANVGQWVGIGGLLVTAIGVTVLVTAPPSRAAPKTSLSVRGYALPGAGGAFVEGTL